MAAQHRIRDVARQAGLSEATVDRVRHGRGGVRPGTVAEVERAMAELDRQQGQVRLVGRTFLVDVVVQAPPRFSRAVRHAVEAELPHLQLAVVRARFAELEGAEPGPVVDRLRRLVRRGSSGVLLKAPDDPAVAAVVDQLADRGVPVVTLASDVPASRRVAYAGMDNRAAGATAAYLVHRLLGSVPGDVLSTGGGRPFRGEDERLAGFRATLADLAPDRSVVEVAERPSGGDLTAQVQAALAAGPRVVALYGAYEYAGGNAAALAGFAAAGRECRAAVVHDLAGGNAELLRSGRVAAVLHHDLRSDVRAACRAVLAAHAGRPLGADVRHRASSPIQVVTPFNLPADSSVEGA